MFDQTFVNAQAQTRRPWTVALSLVLQTALVAVLLILPLLHIATLELPVRIPTLTPFEKVDLKVKPETKAVATPAPSVSRPVFHLMPLRAPIAVPARIDLTPDPPAIGGAPSAATGDSLTGLLPAITIAPPAPQTPIVKPFRTRVQNPVQNPGQPTQIPFLRALNDMVFDCTVINYN